MVKDRRREEKKTVVVESRCVNLFSSDVFEEFGLVEDSGSFGDSWSTFTVTLVVFFGVCACGFVGCACCD